MGFGDELVEPLRVVCMTPKCCSSLDQWRERLTCCYTTPENLENRVANLVLERQPYVSANLRLVLCAAFEMNAEINILGMFGVMFVVSDSAPHVDSRGICASCMLSPSSIFEHAKAIQPRKSQGRRSRGRGLSRIAHVPQLHSRPSR